MGEGGRVITKSVLLTLIRAWVVYEHGSHNLLAHNFISLRHYAHNISLRHYAHNISLRHYAHIITLRCVYVAEHAHIIMYI